MTAACIKHGDDTNFLRDWNSPAYDQLPRLIQKNGALSEYTRRQIVRSLRFLRTMRENADYRPGQTVGKTEAFTCLGEMKVVIKGLGIEDE